MKQMYWAFAVWPDIAVSTPPMYEITSNNHACKTGMIDVRIRAKFTDELHGASAERLEFSFIKYVTSLAA